MNIFDILLMDPYKCVERTDTMNLCLQECCSFNFHVSITK